jgi:tetratricopeptide (TPR) repeat protein
MLEGKLGQKAYLLPVLLVFFFFTTCQLHKKTELSSNDYDIHIKNIKVADALYAAGSYSCLNDAYIIYEELLDVPFEQMAVAEKLLKTALLLSLRVKELGIVNNTYLRRAQELAVKYPNLLEYESYLKVASCIPYSVKGVAGGFLEIGPNLNEYYDWLKTSIKPLNQELKSSAESTEFHAYMYIAFYAAFFYHIGEEVNLMTFLDQFCDSAKIRYRLALYLNKDEDLLEAVLEENPSFEEIHLFLGESAYEEKKLLTAEGHFRKAYNIIPDSLSILVYLAGIHFALEEYDESVRFYEDALHLAPEYREALLGKAICLGYMGKHEYAILVLKKLIEMGRYYMGEAYFWLAWNQNEMEQIEEAEINVKKTEDYLVGDVGVLALQGVISYKLGKLKEAEAYLRQALTLQNNHCDSIYYMAKIDVVREEWENSGTHYEQAGICYGTQERALDARVREIERSPMSVERKAKQIIRKRAQLRKITLTKSTCFYNGAAGYFNAGMENKALVCAAYAALDEAFAIKAEELIKKIESKQNDF